MSNRFYMTVTALLLSSFVPLTTVVAAGKTADDYYGADAMAAARHAMKHHHGDQIVSFFSGERLEYASNEGTALTVWEAQGWIGKDISKFWFKTEGEYEFDDAVFEEIELQFLYSHAVSAFWDLQAGLRHDISPDPSRTFAVFGLQGLAPYWFEIDTSMFISHKGDVSARLEAEYELLLTQRLILQPRVELNLAFSDDQPRLSGSGLNDVEAGLRLRYEMVREFAPYVGINWSKAIGETANLVKQDGADTGSLSFVAGIRFWF